MRDARRRAFQAGLFGLRHQHQPDRSCQRARDHYDDLSVDTYQFLGTPRRVATVATSYIRERRPAAPCSPARCRLAQGHAQQVPAQRSYYCTGPTWGISAGRFLTVGRRDPLRYAARLCRWLADTSGCVLQADWNPVGQRRIPGRASGLTSGWGCNTMFDRSMDAEA